MDPLSVSASIAGLIALATSVGVLSRNICRTLNEDVAGKIATIVLPMENLSTLLKETEDWLKNVESKNKTTLTNLNPYIRDCENEIKEILQQLELIERNGKRGRFKKLYQP
ncbi:hypothetical protein TWF281_007589 [Arthrobotrys megalospora]